MKSKTLPFRFKRSSKKATGSLSIASFKASSVTWVTLSMPSKPIHCSTKCADKPIGTGIGQHAFDFGLEGGRLLKFSFFSQLLQSSIRDARPKYGKAFGQFPVIDPRQAPVLVFSNALSQVEEFGMSENRCQNFLHRPLESIEVRPELIEQAHETVNLTELAGDPGTLYESGKDFATVFFSFPCPCCRRKFFFVCRGWPLSIKGCRNFDSVQVNLKRPLPWALEIFLI